MSRLWQKNLPLKKLFHGILGIWPRLFKLNAKNQWVKELVKMDAVITKLETEKFLSQEAKA